MPHNESPLTTPKDGLAIATSLKSLSARSALLGLSVLLLIAAIPATAFGAWSAPASLAGNDQRNFEPQVDIPDNGEAVATWYGQNVVEGSATSYQVQSALKPLGQNWISPQTVLSIDSAYHQDLSLTPGGSGVLVWAQDSLTEYPYILSRIRSGTGWSDPPLQVSADPKTGPSNFPVVAVNSNGDAVAAWQQCYSSKGSLEEELECFENEGEYTVLASTLSAGSSKWSKPETLSTGEEDGFKLQVAISSAGRPVVLWEDEKNADVHAAILTSSGSVVSKATISPSAGAAGSPQVAFDSSGNATAIWDSSSTGSFRVEASTLSAASTSWSAAQPISEIGPNAFDPQLDVNAAGDAVAAWRVGGVIGNNKIQAIIRSGGVWQGLTNLTGEGTAAASPAVAINNAGQAVAVWWRSDGSLRVEASIRSGGLWSASAPLSVSGQNSVEPDVAIAPDGRAVAIWRTDTPDKPDPGQPQLVQAAEYTTGGGNPTPPPNNNKVGTASAKKSALVKGGAAWLTLTCGKAAKCTGTAKLTLKYKGKNRLAGKKAFTIAAGKTRVVKVPLSKLAKQLLAKRGGTLRVKLSGNHIRARNVVLSVPKRRS